MVICTGCGANLSDGTKYCPECGTPLAQETTQAGPQPGGPFYYSEGQTVGSDTNSYQYSDGQTVASNYSANGQYAFEMPVGMLVWSIIMTLIGSKILGIVSIVFSAIARSRPTVREYQNSIKVAKICNIVNVVLVVLLILALFGFGCLAVTMGVTATDPSVLDGYDFSNSGDIENFLRNYGGNGGSFWNN